jgi:hypothetical protein
MDRTDIHIDQRRHGLDHGKLAHSASRYDPKGRRYRLKRGKLSDGGSEAALAQHFLLRHAGDAKEIPQNI